MPHTNEELPRIHTSQNQIAVRDANGTSWYELQKKTVQDSNLTLVWLASATHATKLTVYPDGHASVVSYDTRIAAKASTDPTAALYMANAFGASRALRCLRTQR